MQNQTIRNQIRNKQTLTALAQKKLIQMAQQGETIPLNTASYYYGLLSHPALKESMMKKSSQTSKKFNINEIKKKKFITSWSQKIIRDANKYKYKNFGEISTSFFLSFGNAGIRSTYQFNNLYKKTISSSTRIQYLGYVSSGIKNKIGFYHINYIFLVGIYEFGKHVKNVLLTYQDSYEYNINDASDRDKILDINNWFYLQEELCMCYGGDYVGRETCLGTCSLCGHSLQDKPHYFTQTEIIQTIKSRFILKFTLILTVDE